MAFVLNAGQRVTLAAICDALVVRLSEAEEEALVRKHPELDPEHVKAFCRSTGSDLAVPAAVEETLAKHGPQDVLRDIGILLTALGTRLGMLIICGCASPFASLSLEQRLSALLGLRTSAFAAKRKAFLSLKSLILLKAAGLNTSKLNPTNHGKDQNSIWSAMGYEGPPRAGQAAAEARDAGREEYIYTMLNDTITKDTALTFDVVIVGSGCGGSVVAAEMAQAGKRVLVLDKGPYVKREDMTGVEGESFDRMYERGGVIASEDTGIGIMAGSCFGGASTINWACCLRTPDHVKEEWAKNYGMPAFIDGTYDAALDAVCKRLGVKTDNIAHNGSNKVLLKGCEKLGYEAAAAPQNLADAGWFEGGGFISTGDPYGMKNSAPLTYLRDAATAGVPAQFADRCEVRRVLHKGGVASGVEASISGAGGKRHSLVVSAPVVVVACGSINSPALLLRSNIPDPHKQIGKNLRLHPVSGASGVMPKDEPVNLWRGAPMTTVSNVVAAGPSNDMYGSKLECPIIHPGLFAGAVPFRSGASLKEALMLYPRAAPLIVLHRDKTAGEVRLDKSGTARVYYPVTDHNVQSLLQGFEHAVRVLEAAGAEALLLPQYDEPIPLSSDPEERRRVVERVVAETKQIGFPLYKVPLFSAHQMGTCRMGSDRKASVVKPTCESWECANLFVTDASCFPTSSGTNPMITTYAIAHMAAQGLRNRFASPPPSKL